MCIYWVYPLLLGMFPMHDKELHFLQMRCGRYFLSRTRSISAACYSWKKTMVSNDTSDMGIVWRTRSNDSVGYCRCFCKQESIVLCDERTLLGRMNWGEKDHPLDHQKPQFPGRQVGWCFRRHTSTKVQLGSIFHLSQRLIFFHRLQETLQRWRRGRPFGLFTCLHRSCLSIKSIIAFHESSGDKYEITHTCFFYFKTYVCSLTFHEKRQKLIFVTSSAVVWSFFWRENPPMHAKEFCCKIKGCFVDTLKSWSCADWTGHRNQIWNKPGGLWGLYYTNHWYTKYQ